MKRGHIQNSFISSRDEIDKLGLDNLEIIDASVPACLYLIATPIGNLEDMTPRAVEILQSVDVVAAEDTRQTMKLFQVFDIKSKLISYHEHNKARQGDYILELLAGGKSVGLVSDAGLPGVSDPGADIAKFALEAGYKVIPIPGVSASLTALIASGLDTERFFFYGFLDRNKGKRRDELKKLANFPYTIIFYESPHRIKLALEDMVKVLGGYRQVSIAREMTKKFEQFIRGDLDFCLEVINQSQVQGEFVIVLAGYDPDMEVSYQESLAEISKDKQALGKREKAENPDDEFPVNLDDANNLAPSLGSILGDDGEAAWWVELSVLAHVDHYILEGMSTSEAIKEVAQERGQPKRKIYNFYHQAPDN